MIVGVIRLKLNQMITVVRETPENFDAVRRLTVNAFAASELGHNGEADLIDAVRDQCDEVISLVALDDDRVVGHILFSRATIQLESSTIHGMGLAPMSVLPTDQRRGVGSQLVREGLRHVADTDAAFTIVAGHPEYYPRFGFLPAKQFSVTHGFAGMPQGILFLHISDQAIRLTDGLAYYHPVFGSQHVE